MIQVALADDERGNQLRVSVQGDKGPDIAISPNAVSILAFGADEAPNLVHFDLFAGQTAHLGIHDLTASLANTHTQAHDGIAMNAGHALNAADAVTLSQHGDRQHFLFGWKVVCHIVFFVD